MLERWRDSKSNFLQWETFVNVADNEVQTPMTWTELMKLKEAFLASARRAELELNRSPFVAAIFRRISCERQLHR